MRSAILGVIFAVVLLLPSVLKAQKAPVITAETTNVQASAGAAATLSVAAAGTAPLTCQWYFNGSPAIINGTIVTVAGGVGDGGLATNAQLFSQCVIKDQNGNLLIADTYDERIRKVDTNGIITTVAGDGHQHG